MTEIKSVSVYDFDDTVYSGDSSVDFWKFCARRHPKTLLSLPRLGFSFVKYLFGLCGKTELKESFFSFLHYLPDVDADVSAFWDKEFSKVQPWYLSEKQESDVIISASPEFLLRPAAEKLGVSLIASRVDAKTGKFSGENCKGEEKTRRFSAEFPNTEVSKFYSDSLSDTPLAELADEAFVVRKNGFVPWREYCPGVLSRMKNTFLARDFLLFVFCGGMGTLTNFVCSLAISTQINPTAAYVFGYGISLFVTYALSAFLIFSEKLRLKDFSKFVVSYIPNFLIQIIFVAVFLNLFCWNKVIVYALAILIGLPISFILVKFFAFGKKGTHKHQLNN